jgi:hypothetical protein
MKFDDIVFLIQTGGTMAAMATGNPMLAASVDAGTRLAQIAHDAYLSGRERGEWSPEQQNHFDNVVLPAITAQPHWQKRPQT